jgi:hypothetical protein
MLEGGKCHLPYCCVADPSEENLPTLRDQISREWRCKWSPDDDKASLVEAPKALEPVFPTVKTVNGVAGVQRVLCGSCMDFKVVTTSPADKFGAWEEAGFAPEGEFIDKLKSIDRLSIVETQTYTVSR